MIAKNVEAVIVKNVEAVIAKKIERLENRICGWKSILNP